MKAGTVALVINHQGNSPVLVDAIVDDQEIEALEKACTTGQGDPLSLVYRLREKISQEDEEFGDYVEELLSQPFLKPDVRNHGVQWLKSKLRIEEFKRKEQEATQVIADYAFKVFLKNPKKVEFVLAGPTARVKIRVFQLASVDSLPEAA